MIEARNLTRRYGEFTAVDGVSFKVDEGEIVGLLGPNGAGKTTTIRMLTGFLPPSEGEIRIADRDLLAEPAKTRRHIGYLPENIALYNEMRVSEYLANRAMLEGMGRAEAREAIAESVEACLLEEVQDQIVGTLSRGYRQRVGLAATILHRPGVLVLDEPTLGLDPKQIIAIRELIRSLGRERTVLLSTHILPEVELLCNRVMIVDRGRIVAEGTPSSLRAGWKGSSLLRVTVQGTPPQARDTLAALEGAISVREMEQTRGRFEIEVEPGRDLREQVFRSAVSRGWVLLELAEESASLEDVFVRLTTQEDAAPTSADEGAEAEPRGGRR